MYSQFAVVANHQFDERQLNFQKCVIFGNWLMIVALVTSLFCLVITFGYDQYFSIAVQIAGHISTIIFAALFKIGYVIRCVGVHGLGYKVF